MRASERTADAADGQDLADRYGPDAAALLVVFVWGINFVWLKAALAEFDALAFTCLRFTGMAALAWTVCWWRRRSRRGSGPVVAQADLARVALAGVLGYTVYMLLSIVGLSYTTAFSNGLLLATAPLFSGALLRWLGVERFGRAQLLGAAVSTVGVVVFFADKVGGGLSAAGAGDLITLAAAASFGAYQVVNKPLVVRYPVAGAMATALSFGAAPVLLLSLPAALGQDWSRVTAGGWAALVWSTAVPVYFAWSVWGWAGGRLGVGRTSLYLYLVPLVSGVAAALWLGEAFGPLKLAGAALTVSGLLLGRRRGAA